MGAIPFVVELAVGQSMQITTPEGRWYSATGIATQGSGLGPPIALFVDPQNSSGLANDANAGQVSTNPIQTTAENDRRIAAAGRLSGSIAITYLSEDLASVPFSTALLDFNGFTITVNMPVITVHAGGHITTVTAINPAAAAGGQRERLQVNDFVVWTPFAVSAHGIGGGSAVFLYVQDTSRDAQAWVMGFETGETNFGHMSRPVNAALSASPAFQVNDNYNIVRPGRLPIIVPVVTNGALVFNHAQLDTLGSSAGTAGEGDVAGIAVTCNHCSINSVLRFGGNFNDCACIDGAQGFFIGNFVAGGYLPNGGTDELTGTFNVSDDWYVTGDSSLEVGGSFLSALFVFLGALGEPTANGVQIQSIANLPGMRVQPGASLAVEGLIWGNGNGGAGLAVAPGATVQLSVTSTFIPNITGATGDFIFEAANGTNTTAQPWDPTIAPNGAYASARATTWANFSATIVAGGFHFGAHFLPSNGHVVA